MSELSKQLNLVYFLSLLFFVSCSRAPVISHKSFHNTYTQEYYKMGILKAQNKCAGRIRNDKKAPIDFTKKSIAKAFAMGADYVEIDTRLTKDNIPVVTHDQYLDCLTNLKGKVSDYTYSELKNKLAPNHRVEFVSQRGSFPLQNKGIGEFMSLEEVLVSFPAGQFLINPKNKTKKEVEVYIEIFKKVKPRSIMIWGPQKLHRYLKENHPWVGSFILNHHQSEPCLQAYRSWKVGTIFPKVCHNISLSVSFNNVDQLPGWPNSFIKRMHEVGSRVYFYLPDLGPSNKDKVYGLAYSKLDGIIVSDLKSYMKLVRGK